jgi:lysozyme
MVAPATRDVTATFIASEEGDSPRVYRDSRGFRTIGRGFNLDQPNARTIWKRAGALEDFDAVLNGAPISQETNDRLFNYKAERIEKAARKIFKDFDRLGVNQQAALQSMVYQLGATGASKFEETLAALASGNGKKVENNILNSRFAKQTPARAKRTALMLAYDLTPAQAERKLVEQGRLASNELKGY